MITPTTALGIALFLLGIGFMAVNTVIQRWLFARTKISVIQNALLEHVFAAPVLLLAWLLGLSAAPAVASSVLFWAALSATIVAGIVIHYSIAKSLSLADASFLAPYEALTLLFIAIAAAGLLNEYPTPQGVFGLLLIVCGLAFQRSRRGVSEHSTPAPAEKIKRAVRWAIISALFSVVGLLGDGLYARNGSVAFASLVYVMALSLVFSIPLVGRKSAGGVGLGEIVRRHWLATAALGLTNGLHFLLIFVAFRIAPIAYIGGLKRLSIVLVAIFSKLLLREGDFRQRIVIAGLVTIGAVILALDGQVVRLQDYVSQLVSR